MLFSAETGPANLPSSRLSLDRSNATGEVSSSHGTVHRRVGAETPDENSIAVVNQELALLPHLTVAENIALPRRPSRMEPVQRRRGTPHRGRCPFVNRPCVCACRRGSARCGLESA